MPTDPVYHFDDSFTLTVSGASSSEPPTWANGLVAEDVGDGIHVHRYDFVTETDYRLVGAGPAMLCVAVVMDGRGTMAIEGAPPPWPEAAPATAASATSCCWAGPPRPRLRPWRGKSSPAAMSARRGASIFGPRSSWRSPM